MIPKRIAQAGTIPSSISSHCPEACRSVGRAECVQAKDGPTRIDTSFHVKAVSGPYIVRRSQFERGEHIGDRNRAISRQFAVSGFQCVEHIIGCLERIRAISGHLLASGF